MDVHKVIFSIKVIEIFKSAESFSGLFLKNILTKFKNNVIINL